MPRAMLAYHDVMRHDAAWYARISLVLSGALRVWGVPGTVMVADGRFHGDLKDGRYLKRRIPETIRSLGGR